MGEINNVSAISKELMSAFYSIPDADGDIKIVGEPGIGIAVSDSHLIRTRRFFFYEVRGLTLL